MTEQFNPVEHFLERHVLTGDTAFVFACDDRHARKQAEDTLLMNGVPFRRGFGNWTDPDGVEWSEPCLMVGSRGFRNLITQIGVIDGQQAVVELDHDGRGWLVWADEDGGFSEAEAPCNLRRGRVVCGEPPEGGDYTRDHASGVCWHLVFDE